MQPRRWREVYQVVNQVALDLPRGSRRFADRVIVLVLLWAAFNHRPVNWACCRSNYPLWMQRLLPRVPSATTLSRRLRSASVTTFLNRVLHACQSDLSHALVAVLDGTALEIRPHSIDPHAGFGHTAGRGRMGKGYKLHVLLDVHGRLLDHRVTPMHVPETFVAARMLTAAPGLAYVLADAGYDSNKLHRTASSCGMQLVAPRQRPGVGLGHHRQTPGRLRSIQLTEGCSPFGRTLLRTRRVVERFFAHADSFAEGLGELPSWVRTAPRVRRWVLAKLIINAVRTRMLRTA